MKQSVFWGLIVLNLILLASLLAPLMQGNAAMAQRAGGSSRRPDLLMIPGEVTGQSSNVVYLIDSANRKLGAIALNQRGNDIEALAPQDLDRVFNEREAGNGGGGKAGGGKAAGGKR